MDDFYKKYKLTPLYTIDFIFSDTKMNRSPCTSCAGGKFTAGIVDTSSQNENGEFIGLQVQGDISKPHEALKIIAALSLTIIILITLTLLFIIVNIATQIKKCGLWIFNVFKTIYKKYIYKSDTNTMDKQ